MSKLINKKSGTGIICAINKGYVYITTPSENKTCNKQTKVCGGCGGCSSAQNKNKNYDEKIYVGKNIAENFTIGSRVNFVKQTLEPTIAAILVFGMPVILALTFVMLNTLEGYERTIGIAYGGAAIFVGFYLVFMADKIFQHFYPSQVTEIQRLTENEQGGANDV